MTHLRLTEVCDSKVGRVSDGGYIELLNTGSLPCRTGGLYLSNSEEDLKQYALPDSVAAAGKLLLIPLDRDVFSLAKSGGTVVILSDGSGRIIDRVDVDKPRDGLYAYCRIGGEGEWNYMIPTPGEENSPSAAIIPSPSFSKPAGYYADEFDLTITADDGAVIHYTTDGTTPTADSPVYKKPIRVKDRSSEPNMRRSLQNIVYDWKNYTPVTQPVKKAFVVRAVAIDAGGAKSSEAAVSYFVGEKIDGDRAVVSLVADDEALFGEDGMYVTGSKYDNWYLNGGEGERPIANFDVKGTECEVSIEYFGDGKKLTFEQKGGLRIQGGSTRLSFSRARRPIPLCSTPDLKTRSACIRFPTGTLRQSSAFPSRSTSTGNSGMTPSCRKNTTTPTSGRPTAWTTWNSSRSASPTK